MSNETKAPRPDMEFWDKICALPHYGFLLAPEGNRVAKAEGIGNWIDKHGAQQVVDEAQQEINGLRAERDASLAREAALREELARKDGVIEDLIQSNGDMTTCLSASEDREADLEHIVMRFIEHRDDLQQRLAAAEQRNLELLTTLRSALQGVEMVGIQDHRIDYALAANIKAEIELVLGRKPTESGASE